MKTPQKSFALKTDVSGTENLFTGQNVFWVHFLLSSNVLFEIFWNQYKKTDCLITYSTYTKKKSFHLLKGTIYTFWGLKG